MMARKLYWADVETSGLSPNSERLLEIVVVEADFDKPFELADEPIVSAVFGLTPNDVAGFSPFIRDMHTKNGLIEECLASATDYAGVEHALCAAIPFVEDREEMPVLAGSSVHFDRGFINYYLPSVGARFSHRYYDVSALKLFAQSLGMPRFPKAEAHRALDDIRESVAHAKAVSEWLRQHYVAEYALGFMNSVTELMSSGTFGAPGAWRYGT